MTKAETLWTLGSTGWQPVAPCNLRGASGDYCRRFAHCLPETPANDGLPARATQTRR